MNRKFPFAMTIATVAMALPFQFCQAQNFKFNRGNSSVKRANVNQNTARGGGARFTPQLKVQTPKFNVRPSTNFGGTTGKVRFPNRPSNNSTTPWKPGVLRPGTLKPGNGAKPPGSFRPNIQLPGTLTPKPGGGINPNVFKPNVLKPNGLNPNVLKPNVLKPNGLKPNVFNPNVLKPNILKPNGFKPNVFKPNTPLAGLAQFQKIAGLNKTPVPFKPLKLQALPGKLGGIKNAQMLQLKSPLGLKAKSFAIQKLSLHPKCHWWVDFCMGWHWHHHHSHWWDHCYSPGYWNCWTPCHYHVIYCPPTVGYISSTWYFGLECVLIPDMACYGVQKVQPNSPAALAGLAPGDMIVSINGFSIADEGVLQRSIQASGGVLRLGVVRDGAAEPVLVDVALQQIRTYSY